MGDWYEFDFVKVNGEYVAGVVFQDKVSNYIERQMQLTDEQRLLVNAWVEKQEALDTEKDELIKSFISSPDSCEITSKNGGQCYD
jgi:anti-sigma-K factor RskA